MEKRILFIGDSVSFIINAIMDALKRNDFVNDASHHQKLAGTEVSGFHGEFSRQCTLFSGNELSDK